MKVMMTILVSAFMLVAAAPSHADQLPVPADPSCRTTVKRAALEHHLGSPAFREFLYERGCASRKSKAKLNLSSDECQTQAADLKEFLPPLQMRIQPLQRKFLPKLNRSARRVKRMNAKLIRLKQKARKTRSKNVRMKARNVRHKMKAEISRGDAIFRRYQTLRAKRLAPEGRDVMVAFFDSITLGCLSTDFREIGEKDADRRGPVASLYSRHFFVLQGSFDLL